MRRMSFTEVVLGHTIDILIVVAIGYPTVMTGQPLFGAFLLFVQLVPWWNLCASRKVMLGEAQRLGFLVVLP